MALRAYGGITDLAATAAASPGAGRFARQFFTALHQALLREEAVQRGVGDKQALVTCIKAAMAAASQELVALYPRIRTCSFRINVPGLSRSKSPDYAFTNGSRYYVIEQKSILRFNEFAEV